MATVECRRITDSAAAAVLIFERQTGAPMPTESYQVCVATHLSPDSCTLGDFAEIASEYDTQGRPITRLRFQVTEQSQLIHILCELHAGNVAILSLQRIHAPKQS
jgi:hypothetical protein